MVQAHNPRDEVGQKATEMVEYHWGPSVPLLAPPGTPCRKYSAPLDLVAWSDLRAGVEGEKPIHTY